MSHRIEHAYNSGMRKALNYYTNDDGILRCFNEIHTSEELVAFYHDEIEPELIKQLDAYLNSDY